MPRLVSTGLAASLVVILLAAAPAARADFTNVFASGEPTVREIFEHFYGSATVTGAATGSGAAHDSYVFSSGVTAVRIADFFPGGPVGQIDLILGFGPDDTDQVWTITGGTFTATARVRFAGYAQEFGYDPTPGDGVVDHNLLFSVPGSGYNPGGSAGPMTLSGQWAWTRDGSGAGPWSSVILDNPDGLDHMIAYTVDEGTSENVWWLFFEDLSGLGDADYNDLVVELRAVPEPATLVFGTVGVALSVLFRRRR